MPDAKFVIRQPGQPEFRTIVCLLTDKQLSELNLDGQVSERLSTWRSIMLQINDHEIVSQASLVWLSMQADEFMKLIVAKLGYESLDSLSKQVFAYADDLLLDGWSVEIPGSSNEDIVIVEDPKTKENRECYWAGPSLMYRPDPRKDDRSDDDDEFRDGGDPNEGGGDDCGDEGNLDSSDEDSLADQPGDSPIEPLSSDLFGYDTVYKYAIAHQARPDLEQEMNNNTDEIAGKFRQPSREDEAANEYGDQEHVHRETDDHTVVTGVSRRYAPIAPRPPAGIKAYGTTDHTTGIAEALKRKRDHDNVKTSRKKARKEGEMRGSDYFKKGAIEQPPDGPSRPPGRCLTCIRYKRKCLPADGIVNGKCWVCRGSPDEDKDKYGTQQRNCYWKDESKGITTYEQAQGYHNGRRIPQNTRAAIAARRISEEGQDYYDDPFAPAPDSSSSILSSTAESTHGSAEAHLSSISGSTQFHSSRYISITLEEIYPSLTVEQAELLTHAVNQMISTGIAGSEPLSNMQNMITTLANMHRRVQLSSNTNTDQNVVHQAHWMRLQLLDQLLHQFRLYMSTFYGLDLRDILNFQGGTSTEVQDPGDATQF